MRRLGRSRRGSWALAGCTAGLCLTVFGQAVVAGQARAEGRVQTRMTVSVIVQPTCVVHVGKAIAQGWSQSVEMRCTEDAGYGLDARSAGKRLSIRPTAPAGTAGQGAGSRGRTETNRFLIERAEVSQQRIGPADSPVTVLAIDF